MKLGDEFRVWLEKRGYAGTSVGKLLRDLATMASTGSDPPKSADRTARLRDYRWAHGLWKEFCKETGRRNQLVEPPEPSKTIRRLGRRQKPAISVPEKEWRRLEQRVALDDSPAALVISVMMETGLRVADVLRTPMKAIRAARKRGDVIELEVKRGKIVRFPFAPAEAAWMALDDALKRLKGDQLVAEGVAHTTRWDANGGAYQAVRRKLQELGAEAGIDTRLHVHRLRRSVGMQLLRAGVPMEHIQLVYVHENLSTTQRYLDEGAADVAGAALAKRKRRPPT